MATLVSELSKVFKSGYRDLLTTAGRQSRIRKRATEIYGEVAPVLDYLERRFDQSKALLMAQRLDRLLVRYQACAALAIPDFEKQLPVDTANPGNAVIAITLCAESLRCAQYIQGWAIDIEQDALTRTSPTTAHPARNDGAEQTIKPQLGAVDRSKMRVYTSSGWIEVSRPKLIDAIEALTRDKGAWLANWKCFGKDPNTNTKMHKELNNALPAISQHIESCSHGYRWTDSPTNSKKQRKAKRAS